jgi:methylated-DNA-protein-cysteine methyltransferase related protein
MTKKTSTDYTFFENVFEVVRQIPKGRISTYGAIASYLGSRQSARMVGWAMNQAHEVKPYVPAHRVVNRNGLLTGKHHFAAIDTMQIALEQEGIVIIDDTVQNFTQVLWDPANELL